MVQVKRNVHSVLAEPTTTSSSLHPSTADRRLKAMRSCSSWNNALLNGRRTRGPQWDYATASYHVAKGSVEYYKGVTPLDVNPVTTSNSSSAPNQYGPGASVHLPTHYPPRAPLHVHALDRHHQQLHSHQHESDQFSNRSLRHTPQPSQTSSHGRPMGTSIPSGPYPHHLQHVGNHLAMPPQSFNSPTIIPSNHPDTKSAIFSAQAPGVVHPSPTGSNMLSSPHFQSGVPPGIPRHMSTTPSLPSSQPDRKDVILSHPASYQNPPPPNQHNIEPPPTSHMRPPPQSFSPAQHHPALPSFEKSPVEGMASPTHSQALRSPAHHGMESQVATSNRKFHPIPSHSHSQRPMTPRSAQAPAGASTNPAHQAFQPIHVGYPTSANVPPPISISSQARNLHYGMSNQPNPHIKLSGGGGPPQELQVPILPSQPGLINEPNQFNQLGSFKSSPPPSMMNNPTGAPPHMNNNLNPSTNNPMGRPLPPNFNPSQFFPTTLVLPNNPPPNTNPSHYASNPSSHYRTS